MKSILKTCTALTMVATFTGQVAAQEMLQSLGAGEGEVSIVAWAGYIEEGATDPNFDWVTSFEEETGCNVNVKVAATSDEMVALMNWAQHIVTLRPGAAEFVAHVSPIFKAHLFLGMTIFLIFPFTRLVHVLSAPVWYLGRRGYQIVRTRKPRKA